MIKINVFRNRKMHSFFLLRSVFAFTAYANNEVSSGWKTMCVRWCKMMMDKICYFMIYMSHHQCVSVVVSDVEDEIAKIIARGELLKDVVYIFRD